MASLPARRPSQRRASPPEQQQQRTPSQSHVSPIRSRSEDSQTIFVHDAEEHDEEQQEQADFPQQPQAPQASGNDGDEDESLKKCWICYNDASESGPERGPWRDPCPCSLTAHEECLLDWIADTEANDRKGNRTIAAPKIECPQCKSGIKIARPRDYLVEAVRAAQRLGKTAIIPSALTALSGVVYGSFAWVGMHSIYAVFGERDGYRILQPVIENVARPPIEVYVGDLEGLSNAVLKVVLDHAVHWRLYLGVPLITPVLILSRTHYADGIIPVLPIVFFASQVHSPDTALDFAQWPPSASFCFALLPYVRSMYNFYYQKVWAAKEKQWLLEVQPKTTQEQAENTDAENPAAAVPPPQDDNLFEIQVDQGFWDDWDNEGQLDQAIVENDAMNGQPIQDDDEAAPGPNVADNRPMPQGGANERPVQAQAQGQQQQQQQQRPRRQRQQNANGDRRLSISINNLTSTVLGAICFPTIAGLTGELLKLVLPKAWTTPPEPSRFFSKSMPRTFLSQKWARSLIGGCLFVVCKDAMMLYVRWKMAQMHRNRSIVDYKKSSNTGRTAS